MTILHVKIVVVVDVSVWQRSLMVLGCFQYEYSHHAPGFLAMLAADRVTARVHTNISAASRASN